MIGLPFGPPGGQLPSVALQGYSERCEAGVRALARACTMDPEREVARFRWCADRLGRQAKTPSGDVLGEITHMVGGSMPLIIELVLTYAGARPRGFVYLTQGRPGGSLPDNIGELLSGALQIHVEDRGEDAEARLLADVFRLAFPDLARLGTFSALAQGLLVGVAPDGEHVRLKVYFNTRLAPIGSHRDKIAGMLERCGLDDRGLYEALYEQVDGAAFHGFGLDLDGDGSRRAKLYVRVPRDGIESALRNVAASVGGSRHQADSLIAPAERMLAALAGDGLANEVELAGALCDDGAPTVKVTLFYSAAHVSEADMQRVAAYLGEVGYDPASLLEAVEALSAGVDQPEVQKHPMHGIGIEVPVGGRPKLNVYVQPVV